MNLFNRSNLPFFVIATFLGVIFTGCLDAPGYPHALQPVESISIMVQQKTDSYSTQLKVNPSDTATIKASVTPEKFQDDISFEWFYTNDGKDSLLSRESVYSFYPSKNEGAIPNKLIAMDNDGNQQIYDFTIAINTPPELSESTIPADGDTLYGSEFSAFLFEWYSFDRDFSSGDTLFHILEIDDKKYDVGTLLQVKQSGFKAGEHKFRIIVNDIYGDAETSTYRNFYVVDTLEAK